MTNNIRCPQCNSTDITKNGRRLTKKRGSIQRYGCKNCNYKFCLEPMNKMVNREETVSYALHLRGEGHSFREIRDKIKQKFGTKVHHASVVRWVQDFETEQTETKEYIIMIDSDNFSTTLKVSMKPQEMMKHIDKLVNKPKVRRKK